MRTSGSSHTNTSGVDATPYLAKIRTPTLGLYPSHSPITIQEQEKTITAGIRGIRIVHAPSRHHAIQNIMPATLAKELLRFASQQDGTPSEEA